MTQSDKILEFLRTHGGSATLGDLLEAGRFSFAHKLTARISDARKKGFNIVCERGETPSKNVYKLVEDQNTTNVVKVYYDEFSQGAFL